MAIVLCSLNIQGFAATIQEFEFEVAGENLILTGYNGVGGTVVIPAEVNGTQVIGIADSVFNGQPLTLVTIPSTITSIGAKAFYGTDLTSACLHK